MSNVVTRCWKCQVCCLKPYPKPKIKKGDDPPLEKMLNLESVAPIISTQVVEGQVLISQLHQVLRVTINAAQTNRRQGNKKELFPDCVLLKVT